MKGYTVCSNKPISSLSFEKKGKDFYGCYL